MAIIARECFKPQEEMKIGRDREKGGGGGNGAMPLWV